MMRREVNEEAKRERGRVREQISMWGLEQLWSRSLFGPSCPAQVVFLRSEEHFVMALNFALARTLAEGSRYPGIKLLFRQ